MIIGGYSDKSKYLYYLEHETSMIQAYQWKEMNCYLNGVELLQTRQKRVVVLIVRKALSVLSGTVSEDNIKTIRRKLKNVEEGQKVLA